MLFLVLAIYIIAKICDSIFYSNVRNNARNKGYRSYYGQGGLRNVSDNSKVGFDEIHRELELNMYKNLYEKGYQNDKLFRENYPTLQDYINYRDGLKKIL